MSCRVGGALLLHPDQQMFEAMPAGWRDQQLAWHLKADVDRDGGGFCVFGLPAQIIDSSL